MKFNPDDPAYPCEVFVMPGAFKVHFKGFTKRERLIESAMIAQIKSTGGFDATTLVKQVDNLINELQK